MGWEWQRGGGEAVGTGGEGSTVTESETQLVQKGHNGERHAQEKG